MLDQPAPKSESAARQNLQWLYILRNLMIAGESMLIFLSINALNIRLPQQQLWLVVLSLAAFNFYTSLRMKTEEPVTDAELFSQLSVDVLGIAALLYLTGGASNPITWVFLLPLMVTALMLPPAYAWYMVILTTSFYTALIAFNIPLPSIEPHAPNPEPDLAITDPAYYQMMQHTHVMNDKSYYSLHMFGMWFGFVFIAGIMAYFVAELARALKLKERSLAVARENALRDERVVALGTLAASAAHDMGTPLGIIDIVAHELEQDYPVHRHPDLHEKSLIMQQQIARCKEALSVMSASAGEMRAESGRMMAVTDYIDNVITQWRAHKPGTKLRLFIDSEAAADASLIAERTLTHAIINILNNAAEATDPERGIEFYGFWNQDILKIKICDYGPGLPPEVADIVGRQPLVSKKRGLGVGLFLTCSTINRMGGRIQFTNKETGGAAVEIELSLMAEDKHDG